MNLFDKLVNEAIKNQDEYSSLKVVIEKELLHHDILRIMSHNNLLKELTFIGGTALRSCYGGLRLSEDLDFTRGNDFSKAQLTSLSQVIIDSLESKYGLHTTVSDPVKDHTNVDTWKIKINTKPQQKHLPTQRINIDICSVPSYERKPMMLLNPYGVDMGTNGLIIQVQSKEEIFVDKLLAFALRPNRIKYRDLWDILWLHQQGVSPRYTLIPNKLADRSLSSAHFIALYQKRIELLSNDSKISTEFRKEMLRFLPEHKILHIIEQDGFWDFLLHLMKEFIPKIVS